MILKILINLIDISKKIFVLNNAELYHNRFLCSNLLNKNFTYSQISRGLKILPILSDSALSGTAQHQLF